MKKWLGTLAAIIVILLLGIIAWHRFRVPVKGFLFSVFPVFSYESVDQPVLFNHIRHTETAKLTCSFCHRFVERHRSAGIPNIELCRACHSSDAISKRPEALRVVEYVKAGKPIPWKRMYELPPFVVFPHWVHVQGKVDCSVCHGLTGASERPVRMVDRLYMEWCVDCHEKKGASTDCYACHSN